MLRGSGVKWENDASLIPSDLETKLEGMRRMFQAQQRGVERARQEVGGSSRVMHAIEINKLYAYKDDRYQTMMELNVPCLLSDVVTHCRGDLVSWSAYDGIFGKVRDDFPIGLARGIEVIEAYINPTGYCNKLPVQIGEIARDENGWYKQTDAVLRNFHEKLAGLARYKNIQAYIERFRSAKIYAKSCYDTDENLIWLTTSAKPGTGKTVFTANMAIVSAFDTDETVLLVDMSNNIKDSISSALELSDKKGILDYLSGNAAFDEILYKTKYDNLTVIPRGNLPDNFKGSVFQSTKIRDMFKIIRQRFNLTMMEIPDILSNADSVAIIPETDGVFATVNMYYSKRGPLKAGIEKIQKDKVIGCIANYVEFWIPAWLYKWV